MVSRSEEQSEKKREENRMPLLERFHGWACVHHLIIIIMVVFPAGVTLVINGINNRDIRPDHL
jgi:hypothetical protein